jgi:replicative DNA helicase
MISGTLESTVPDNAIMNGTSGKIAANPGLRFKSIPLKFDIETLDLLMAYAYDDSSTFITRASLINLRSLIDMCNMSLYKTNQSLKTRFEFIKLILEARLDTGLDNRKLLLSYAMERVDQKELVREEILPELIKLKLNSRAIQHLNTYITDRLMYGFMYSYKAEIFKIYENMESGNFGTLRDLTQEFKGILNDLVYDIRNSENYKEENMTIDLSEGNFENVVMQLVARLQEPGNKLKTGSQAVNMMLNGGFESDRSYLVYGLPGIGKSVVLLNFCEWIRVHNVIKPKDPTKRPAILYITQENSLAETIERLFNMTVSGDDIRDYTPAEVAHLLRTKGQLILKGKYDIDLIIKYYDDKEISTVDLYSIIDDVEDTGKEVIALVHDYIERIRSSQNLPDIRLELAAVANDYSVLAKRLHIPVIGAGQINRKGSDTIDSGVEANRADLVRLLGRGAISESWAMLKNLDAAFLIHKEMDEEGNEYITFLKIKFRGNPGKKKKKLFESYVAHPFDPENGIKLMDDLHLDSPLSKLTLDDSLKDLDVIKKSKSLREKRELKRPNKTETIEQIEEEPQVMNFKVIEEAIRMRKKMEVKTEKVTDTKAEKEFEKVFSAYIDSEEFEYKRAQSGFIHLSLKKAGW